MMFEILPLVSAQEVPSLGGSALSMGFQLLTAAMAIIGLSILFFGGKWAFTAWKKYKNYKISALVLNPDGTFFIKKMGKFRTADNIDKMLFQGSNETMPVINPKHIRARQVILYRYGVGQYAVIPPQMWEKIDLKKFKIELINMQAKNFAFLEQRAAISRWAYIKDLLNRWGPYMTLLFISVTAGVVVWFMMKLGYNIFSDAIDARILECRQLIGTVVPTGVPTGA